MSICICIRQVPLKGQVNQAPVSKHLWVSAIVSYWVCCVIIFSDFQEVFNLFISSLIKLSLSRELFSFHGFVGFLVFVVVIIVHLFVYF